MAVLNRGKLLIVFFYVVFFCFCFDRGSFEFVCGNLAVVGGFGGGFVFVLVRLLL
jgi:hypothetical protein